MEKQQKGLKLNAFGLYVEVNRLALGDVKDFLWILGVDNIPSLDAIVNAKSIDEFKTCETKYVPEKMSLVKGISMIARYFGAGKINIPKDYIVSKDDIRGICYAIFANMITRCVSTVEGQIIDMRTSFIIDVTNAIRGCRISAHSKPEEEKKTTVKETKTEVVVENKSEGKDEKIVFPTIKSKEEMDKEAEAKAKLAKAEAAKKPIANEQKVANANNQKYQPKKNNQKPVVNKPNEVVDQARIKIDVNKWIDKKSIPESISGDLQNELFYRVSRVIESILNAGPRSQFYAVRDSVMRAKFYYDGIVANNGIVQFNINNGFIGISMKDDGTNKGITSFNFYQVGANKSKMA